MINASRAFYGLLGFCERPEGRRPPPGPSCSTRGWSVLLASTGPALDIPALPLLFYFFYDDIEAVIGALAGTGASVIRTGHPSHALGGEVKVLDPDGNTVLLGQRERSASRAPAGTLTFGVLVAHPGHRHPATRASGSSIASTGLDRGNS